MLNIGGFKASSLVNFPRRLTSVVFTNGCNMRCAYCHNGSLALGEEPSIPEEVVLDKIKENLEYCKNVVISGGEPTIQEDAVISFCEKLKNMGVHKIKLDTNGTSSKIICHLVKEGMLNYVAMDIKSKEHYLDRRVQKTIHHLYQLRNERQDDTVFNFEFRTTLDKGYVTPEDIEYMLDVLCNSYIAYFDKFDNCCSPVWYFQQCNIPEKQLLSTDKKVEPYTDEDIMKLLECHRKFYTSNTNQYPIQVIRRFSV